MIGKIESLGGVAAQQLTKLISGEVPGVSFAETLQQSQVQAAAALGNVDEVTKRSGCCGASAVQPSEDVAMDLTPSEDLASKLK